MTPETLARKDAVYRQVSRTMTALWTDPVFQRRMSQCMKAAAADPASKRRKSLRTKSLWADPGFRKRHAQAISDPEYRRRQSHQAKAQWADPAYRRRESCRMKAMWTNPVYRRHREKAWRTWWESVARKRAFIASPNKLERKVQKALNQWFPKEWRYNRGIVVLDGMVPDFVNVNGRKAVIEVNGDYWHRTVHPENRKPARYRRLGYRCVVIWEREFKRDPSILRRKVEALR